MTQPASDTAATVVKTTCPYCGVGCGVLASPDGRGGAGIAGDPEHPANRGRLCSKGSALGETLSLENRLLHPEIDGRRASWEEALGAVTGGLRRIAEAHGPDSIAFYLSGQLLTEDYYVANKLAKGFLGTPHVDTNSRLCMSSAVAAHRRAFGSDTVPGCYEDLDEADLLVLTGSNTAWCHPILFRRMIDARAKRGTKIVVIDPRRTQTGEEADLFLGLRPGSDTALFSGLLVHLAATGKLDPRFIKEHTAGFDGAIERARQIAPDVAATAAATGLAEADVAAFFALFAETKRVVTCFSMGVNQSAQGTDKGNAIINCHLATGRIGQPGMGPFSLTGQPNAMGGREVGGLANMLAAHMHFAPEEVDRVKRFWNAPRIITGEGMKAIALFEAIERGKIKALWVMGTNPVVSMPQADRVLAAIAKLDLFVVSEAVADSDTARAAGHKTILLPALAWGEKDGTVTNSERRISRQRAFLKAPGEARADWAIMSEIGRRLGHGAAFPYTNVAQIFREHAALSAFENNGSRDFDIGGLVELNDRAYEAAAPVQWPLPKKLSGKGGQPRLFGDGRFFTFDRRARFVAVQAPALATAPSAPFPLVLNTGRVRDHWHTMTRTGKSQRLSAHRAVPFVEVSPEDARRLQLAEGGFARVTTEQGSAVLEVTVTDGVRPGEIFAPMHWSAMTASDARVGALTRGMPDPVSGQPELKATPAALEAVAFRSRGYLITREPQAAPQGWWWARATVQDGSGLIFATQDGSREIALALRGAFQGLDIAEYSDHGRGLYRLAAYDGARLVASLAVVPGEASRPDWELAKSAFAAGALESGDRRALLTGRAATPSAGPTICACHGVGLDVITACIAAGAGSVEAVGAACKAGTNCGSCIPEIRKLLPEPLARSAA
ncbi:nitrate reductase [Methylobacterium organophilum]|uniref:Nitrate reductase n=1 Tax=Methylobacterium organophilum TaxID=410 RepID=A0ABQ4TBF8_METOR|nr:nitrate reductase [Methylobacterium organophilum]GJE28977.1 Nitrate reductase [Methylobacterium organophilum]